MTTNARTTAARELMAAFAHRTGSTSTAKPRRYLWTDAFAVCNYLELWRASGDDGYRDLARQLVDQVHHELGRHRGDDTRRGWLSGISDADAVVHPTRGGLRIGKKLPERGPGDTFHAVLEWERDGQYFHYLTKWMHALDQMTRRTGMLAFTAWARELAEVAHRAFSFGPPERRRMAWKLSIDLSRQLVSSMGQHDPIDGLVTCLQLEATTQDLRLPRIPDLSGAIRDYARMIERDSLATTDPLGLGGVLTDAHRLAQVGMAPDLVEALLEGALGGLSCVVARDELRAGADERLAFRELGLAIGLSAVHAMQTSRSAPLRPRARELVDELASYVPLGHEIEAFWLDADHRRSATWKEHEDINAVMLASAMLPAGFLDLGLSPSKELVETVPHSGLRPRARSRGVST